MTIYKKYQHLQYHMHTQYECSNDTETFLYSHLNFNKVDFDQKLNASYFGKE
jgi:hypothetical protein